MFTESRAVVIIAPPYGGKDTQADMLEALDYKKISTSELANRNSNPAEQALMSVGNYFTDERACTLVGEELKVLHAVRNVAIVGFPRTATQAYFAINEFKNHGRLPFFIFLDVPDVMCLDRYDSRGPRTDEHGHVRDDDKRAVLVARLSKYRKSLIELNRVLYSECPEFCLPLSGTRKPDVIHKDILDAIDSRIHDHLSSGAKKVTCFA